jgi:hypothetical protein
MMFVAVSPFLAYLAIGIIAGSSILLYFIVRGSDEYSVEQTEETAEEFAGTIKEANGPVMKWLWIVYIALTVWALLYLYINWANFVAP